MKTRNAKYNKHGTIDCEIDHPTYGWIPFTASPDDVEESGRTIHAELFAAGNIAAYVPPSASIILDSKRNSATLTRMEFILALDDALLLDDADTLVNDATTPKRVKLMWANASSFDRMYPELLQMATAMGITDQQLDDLFGIV